MLVDTDYLKINNFLANIKQNTIDKAKTYKFLKEFDYEIKTMHKLFNSVCILFWVLKENIKRDWNILPINVRHMVYQIYIIDHGLKAIVGDENEWICGYIFKCLKNKSGNDLFNWINLLILKLQNSSPIIFNNLII